MRGRVLIEHNFNKGFRYFENNAYKNDQLSTFIHAFCKNQLLVKVWAKG